MKSPWFKVRIVSCCDKAAFWYADKIGDVIIVKQTDWHHAAGWGFEHKSGSSVFQRDVERIAK